MPIARALPGNLFSQRLGYKMAVSKSVPSFESSGFAVVAQVLADSEHKIWCRTLTYDLRTAPRRRRVTGEKPCQGPWDFFSRSAVNAIGRRVVGLGASSREGR